MAGTDTQSVFVDIVDRAKTIDPVNTRKWFDELTVLRFAGGSLQIGCPNDAAAMFLQDNCSSSFTQAAQQITGHLVSVTFNPGTNEEAGTRDRDSEPELKLHADYTFENFVVGPSNRLAHASCVAVSQSPGNTYNPLFLHGSSGLGKTHLLHAVCSEAKERNHAVIQFLSCENFVNRFIRAIEIGDLSGFQSQHFPQ